MVPSAETRAYEIIAKKGTRHERFMFYKTYKTYNIKATASKSLQQAAHTRPDATHIILSKIGRVVFFTKRNLNFSMKW